jgi:rod shape-determining protein MreB
VIANPKVTEKMLRYFINKVQDGPRWVKPRVVIAVPVGITAVERRAVINATERAGARDVYLIPEPMAAGVGCDLPVTEPRGSLIVDIGGGTTEIAVLSLAGIVTATSLRIAGDEMDEAVVSHLRRHHNLMIGEGSAERVKLTIGSAWSMDEELSYVVSGRDSVTGLPRSTTVTSIEIREALAHPVRLICEAIRGQLELAPPEISADLVGSGLVMVGGGSLLNKLPEAIEDYLGLPVRMGDDPLTAVARGTGVVLNKLDIFKDVLGTEEDL